MFITQTASIIDDLLAVKPFYKSKLYQKIHHLLYVPISKEGLPEEWMFLKPIEIDLELPKYHQLSQQLKADYYDICDKLNDQLCCSNTSTLHTASDKFLQIRTKDSKPFHPIFSKIQGDNSYAQYIRHI